MFSAPSPRSWSGPSRRVARVLAPPLVASLAASLVSCTPASAPRSPSGTAQGEVGRAPLGSRPPAPAADPHAPAAPAAAGSARPPSASAPSGSPAPRAPARPAPASAAECKAMVGSDALPETDAKVTPGEGAGKSDRFAGIVAAIREKRPALRCCYELWAKDHPRRDARVVLDYKLDEQGLPTEVQLRRAVSDKLGDDTEACIVDVAMAIPYPPSPSDRVTTFEYELGFKHHKAPPSSP